MECNEIFTEGLPKNLKDLGNKRQVLHTSTVLELSTPFQTLVKLVDAEDIANDKINTQDLEFKVNNLTKQFKTQILDSSHQEQLMFTQPGDPNNKKKPVNKKYCSYCQRASHSISACFKNKETMKTKEIPLLYPNLLKSHLYSTFVLPQTTEPNDMILAIEVEVIHEITITTKITIHSTDIFQHLKSI